MFSHKPNNFPVDNPKDYEGDLVNLPSASEATHLRRSISKAPFKLNSEIAVKDLRRILNDAHSQLEEPRPEARPEARSLLMRLPAPNVNFTAQKLVGHVSGKLYVMGRFIKPISKIFRSLFLKRGTA